MSHNQNSMSFCTLYSSLSRFMRRDGWFWLIIPRGMTLVVTGIIITITTLLALLYAYHSQGAIPFPKPENFSVTVLDRNDKLLRAFTTDQGRWRLPVTLQEVDPDYIKMLLAYEDKRFYSHHGVDPLAIMRAVWQFSKNGKIISGGSTLTMQVARLLEPREKRSLKAKLKQALRAIQLEQELSKEQILNLYLVLAPMGGNLEGVRAASLAYFNREPKRLTLAQAAQLVAIPQSPEYRRPDTRPQAALKSRNVVLKRVSGQKGSFLTPSEARGAMIETMVKKRKSFPKLAAHLTQSEVLARPRQQVHHLTIDRSMQKRMEQLVSNHARRFSKRHSIAMLITDNKSGDVLVHIGAPDFMAKGGSSHIDMTRAWRSPGSTLKPFIYGMGFEDGLIHPATMIIDEPTHFGSYSPKNFDGGFHGTLSIRKALQLSLNIPAVKVLHKVKPGRLLARFKQNNIGIKLPVGAKANISIALGGLGMRLSDLAKLYMGLARGGNTIPLNWHKRNAFDLSSTTTESRLLSPVASWYISSILQGVAQTNQKTPFAFKTGTSYGYRDAWVVGYNARYTVAIWVGRPDGTASPGMTGNLAAVPILLDSFRRLGSPALLPRHAPQNALIVQNSRLPRPLQQFEPTALTTNGSRSAKNVRIAFPRPKTILALKNNGANHNMQSFEELMIKAEGGSLPLTWTINGAPIGQSYRRRTTFWKPTEEGFVRLGVIDSKGHSDSIMVRVN